jgi:hypothetical protein
MQHRSCSRRAVRRLLGIGYAPFHEIGQRAGTIGPTVIRNGKEQTVVIGVKSFNAS